MKPTLQKSFLIAVTLLLAACAASGSQESPAISTPEPLEPSLTATSLPLPPTSTSTSIPTILPTPSSIIPFEQRLLATIDINYPDEIAFVQGFIWVKTDDGHVVQVDPATNSVVGDIKVDTTSDPFHYCQGLGTDGENIWACSASGDEDPRTIDVVRIDPDSQSVVETVKVGKIFDQFNMPFLLNQIWVLSGSGDKLVGIDVTTNQPSPAIDLGSRCFQVAVESSSLLVTCRLDNIVLRVDPEKMEVTERLTIAGPRNITATENGIWLSQDNIVVRLDSQSLHPVATFTNLFNPDIFATKDAVWVRLEDGFLYRFDPVNNQLIEQIKTDQNLSTGSILVTPDAIWTTASDDNLLIRLSVE